MSDNPKVLTIYKNRTAVIPLSLGFDVSGDTFSSEVRVAPDVSSEKIAEFVVTFDSDGTDGELILTMDNSVVDLVTRTKGYMDVKRVSNGEPFAVFSEPLEVFFKGSVTA